MYPPLLLALQVPGSLSSVAIGAGSSFLELISSSTMNAPVRIFAALPAAETDDKDKQQGLELTCLNKPVREVQVTGVAEVSCPADRAWLLVSVTSTKDSINEVTNSISRRLEYISQTIRQHGVSEEDTTVRRTLRRHAETYTMDAEIVVTFSEFKKMEHMCCVLLEKLDKSVQVGTPRFFHSAACLSELRLRASVSAVENAQQKASQIAEMLGESLGATLLVREEETKEWRNEEEATDGERSLTHVPPLLPTATVTSQVSVSFSFKDKSRKKL
ncbi:interleukin-1 receptor-associated kinase 1-binding protein 1 homolog [Poecilia formosa]|uniref:interleukin-1 receptor-associated kinase 1-binding protein 1 homolog n=1 Tax=Poecilia formosa TaxID=48698 RepID=UPI0007BAD6BD|nr:PREDICTED: interleukin-1 receptor-associated kinase 1-binding protein 1 homolog [Poecilia formosa]XP_007566674.2 PREDICTED: interleukin-1 receptor-associated kinase 1-binding protein 1 homolog [Poecilia formosa]